MKPLTYYLAYNLRKIRRNSIHKITTISTYNKKPERRLIITHFLGDPFLALKLSLREIKDFLQSHLTVCTYYVRCKYVVETTM